jgi:predicted transcriptional regulator
VTNREKAQMLAYVLWDEFNAKQKNIALVLNVSEGTISLWLKEMRLKAENYALRQELNEVRQIAQQLQAAGRLEARLTYDIENL